MTDEEFERLKEAEKKHLREKKQMRRTLAALKKRSRAEGILQKMKHGAQRLLQETESLVDTLQSQVARNEAQLEVALDKSEQLDDLHDAEEALRDERAESLVRQYKEASGSVSSRSKRATGATSSEAESDAEASESSPDGPEKTIGRMRTSRSDDDSA
jgi:cell division septum initiation protein DivIVA